jgi:hypothetical protein
MLTATVPSKTGLAAPAQSQANCNGGGSGVFVLNITGQCGGQQKRTEFRSRRMRDDDRRSGVGILKYLEREPIKMYTIYLNFQYFGTRNFTRRIGNV